MRSGNDFVKNPEVRVVRPVGGRIGDGAAAVPHLSFFMAGMGHGQWHVQHQIVKNLVTPRFTNLAKDWGSFVFDFDQYLKNVTAGIPLPDALKLSYLLTCLPGDLQNEHKYMAKSIGKDITHR